MAKSPDSREDDASLDRQGDPPSADPPHLIPVDLPFVQDEEYLEEIPLADIDLTDADFADDVVLNADQAVDASAASIKAKLAVPKLPAKELVLIGAGRVHLQLVESWPRRRIPNVNLTLISAFGQATRGSMLAGTLAGIYRSQEMLIDLPQLCEKRGVKLIVDRANSFDPVAREIEFAHQPRLTFDLASINIGSVPSEEQLWQSHRIMIGVKPHSTFLARFQVRFQELVEQWRQAPGEEMLQVVVVGSGLQAVELAFGLEQRRFDLELPIDVRIVDGGREILAGCSPKTIRKVKKLFHQRGIEMNLGSSVVDCDDLGPATLILANGSTIRADLVIWVAGEAPPIALQGFQLPKSPRGFLTVRPTLQSTANVPVFAVGDVAELVGNTLPKSDIDPVSQAAVLQRNLARWFTDQPLATYWPKHSTSSLISCGDRTALMSYGNVCVRSRWAWWLKDRLDRRWVRRFQV